MAMKTRKDYISGTAAERVAYAGTLHRGMEWLEPNGDIYQWTGTQWVQTASGGASSVFIGEVGAAHNRNIAAAATTHPGDNTTNTATWTSTEGVRELSIRAIEGTGAASTSALAYLVVVNAPTAAIAKTWLEDAGTLSQDVVYEMGYYAEELTIRRTTAITRVDVLPIGDMGTSRFVIGAV